MTICWEQIVLEDAKDSGEPNVRYFDIKDIIYDGTEYCQLSKRGGFLCPTTNPANRNIVLNTDGVPLFKSSETSVWPIFLVTNELPANIR